LAEFKSNIVKTQEQNQPFLPIDHLGDHVISPPRQWDFNGPVIFPKLYPFRIANLTNQHLICYSARYILLRFFIHYMILWIINLH